MNIFRRTKARRLAREALKHAKHVRNMREDLFSRDDSDHLQTAEANVKTALAEKDRDAAALHDAVRDLHGHLALLSPRQSFATFKENVEILVVALTVAMAFRAYFVQPFKIPTGSMEPTLFGIHTQNNVEPTLMDRLPLKALKWIATGRWYREVRVNVPGDLSLPYEAGPNDPSSVFFSVGPRRYRIPKAARIRFRPGQYVPKGSVLWAGSVTTGDHVFVDKLRWNFCGPRRGRVIVFSTQGIPGIPEGTHYIKRLIGLPDETISIDPPEVLADGRPLLEPEAIGRIARREGRYIAGFTLPDKGEPLLRDPSDTIELGPDEFFVLGDNTRNSRDGRYWGTVPRENLVGPAFMVYWPLSPRWGRIDG